MSHANLISDPAHQSDALQQIQASLLKMRSRSTRMLVEANVSAGSIGLHLMQSNAVESLAVNSPDPLCFAFLFIAFGKSCANKRELNWLANELLTAPIPAQSSPAPALDPSASLKENALAYGLTQISQRMAEGLDEKAARTAIFALVNDLYACRHKTPTVACLDPRSFIRQIADEVDSGAVYYINSGGMDSTEVSSLIGWLSKLGKPWHVFAPKAAVAGLWKTPGLSLTNMSTPYGTWVSKANFGPAVYGNQASEALAA